MAEKNLIPGRIRRTLSLLRRSSRQNQKVLYTRSLFQELKLRLDVASEDRVKGILRRLYNVKYHLDKYKENEEDVSNKNILVSVFASEIKSWFAFTSDNLEYLDFPVWLAEKVDRGDLKAEQGYNLNQKKAKV